MAVTIKVTLTVDDEVFRDMQKRMKTLGFRNVAQYCRYLIHKDLGYHS